MTTTAQKKATNNYRSKALANVAFVISHTEPQILQALNDIMAHHNTTKAGAIKLALTHYANSLKTL